MSTPYSFATFLLPSNRIGNRRSSRFSIASASLRLSSTLTASSMKPAARYWAYTLFSSGSSWRQGPHQLAQKLINTTWASWCGPCRQELPLLNKVYAQYRAAGFMLLAVNVDDNRKDADAMLKRLDL